MEPFVVICETCHSRLKVRSEAAIGEIHACPRCDSMVHILPPSGAGDSAAKPRAGLRRPRQFARVERPTQEAADAFAAAAVAVLAGASASSVEVDISAIDVASANVAPAPLAGATYAGHPGTLAWLNGLWIERPLMLLGGGAATLVIAGALTIGIWPSRDDASAVATPVVANAPIAPEPVAPAPTEVPIPSPDSAANTVAADDVPTVQPALAPTTDAKDPNVAQASPPPVQQVGTPAAVAEQRAVVSAAAKVADDVKPSTNPPPQAANEPHAPVFTLDPLDFDPSRLSLPQGRTQAQPDGASLAAASVKQTPDTAPPVTAGGMGNAGGNARLPQEPQDNPSITVRRGPPPAESTQAQTVAARLAFPVRALNIHGPLERVLEQISELAGVPITLDPAALALTGVSPRKEVAIDLQNTTIDGALQELLTRQRLGVIERDGQLVVVRPAGNVQLSPTYDVSDLVAPGEQDAAHVAELIQRFVAPETWEATGGVGTLAVQGGALQIQQAEQIHIGLIVFCERLRVARGLAPKSRYPADRLLAESPYSRLADKLARPTTFTFVPWTPLADVFRDWSELSGVTMLVDWRSLSRLELSPTSPVAASAIARTWEDALDEILAPLELGWRAVDGETIQITSAAAAENLQNVEFFRVLPALRDQFANSAALVDALRRELADKAGVAGSSAEMAVDGDRLIVLASAGVHRYLTKRLAN